MDQRLFGLSAAAPPEKKNKRVAPIETESVWQPHPKDKVTDRAKQEN